MKTKQRGILTLLLAFIVHITFAQQKTISGTVTDQDGIPLPGVNILVKGTTTGTQTDFDGKYSISASSGQVLLFTYLGQTPTSRTVNNQDVINVQMTEDAEALQEVVVTALGISREKKSLGYSTQTVSGDDIAETRSSNALNAMSGKVAGVQISNNSGNLGGSTRIVLRGPSSITQENRPLMVVDGIPLDNSNYNSSSTQTGGGGRDFGDAGFDINPDDIETMNILKGGAAAALYGSRASNGVILITTKSGKKGKAQITINSGITFDKVNILPKVQNLYGGGAGDASTIGQVGFGTTTINGTVYNVVDYGTDESWGPRYEGQQVLHWDAFDPEFSDDYLQTRPWVAPKNDKDSFWNTGVTYNNGVSFSQGTEKSTVRLSANKTSTTGIVPNSELNKSSVNFNATSQLTDKLKVDALVNLTITDGFNRPASGYTGSGVVQQMYQFGQTSLDFERLKKYKREDGTQRSWNRVSAEDGSPRYSDNPYWTLYENTSEDKRTRWYGNIGATYNFTDELYVVAKIYADTYDFRINDRRAVGSQSPAFYTETDRDFQEINYEARLHFDKKFMDDKFSVNSFIGTNRRDNEFHRLSATTSGGLVVPGLYNISNSSDPAQATEYDSYKRVNSVYGSVSLGYDNFAYLTVVGRSDWSSTLPENDNSFFYPGVNGSIVFSNLIKADWLSFGKIRGGYAEVGSDTDPYQLATTFVADIPFLGDVPFSTNGISQNPNLRPELKQTYEVGLEMAFLKNRLSFDLTYYNEETSDLITPVTVDPSTGYNSTFTNAGVLRNRGIEALVNITPIQTEDFSWDFTWNFSKNDNELLEIIDGVESLQIASFPFNSVSINAVVGESYGVIRGTNFVFDDQGNKVVNANGSYAETQNVENLGSILPDYNMGFKNSFRYKNLSLGFLIDVQKGGKYRSLTNIWGNYSGILEQTATNNKREVGTVLEGVTGTITYDANGDYVVTNTAPNTQVISAQQEGTDYYFGADAANVFNADYVKLREVSLSYKLPSNLLKNTGISAVNISAFGRNLGVWGLDNDNFDPEVATSGSGNIQGSEGGSLPSTKSYGLNLQLKF
ncbi:SusC/RagA family TonB-linked outer membrane protein [Cellulophaga lytica]|uniref:TonB-dependent receptor plug n=1 Tax=Cellulophaga lytica (strain ATCC 23178 / DSM 7489 / JCM 8516 / NBRC 14961 / NCIMB 1423 / VKM B-1433 / Cy l20) TaxID=867900 RepID=F0REY2_CELLC|nr:SusC/RagA family TonB-linked outer membrane protein [Cellulophaga lytica]ADY29957.1 TonB-dependent receptor plug [Cellulophaga lytica DSM 7489]AIM60952.1 membrane protein [Cellulophaga lytica]WQG75879.1 SusC/RagA family TonB-linked outer membrane protein [Cellulophaga lytica]